VTVGGALAAAVHHHGVGFSELVEEATVMLSNGSLLVVVPGQELFDLIPGSVGTIGFVVEAVLRTEPRRAFEWTSTRHTWTDEDGLATLMGEWQANGTRQSVLWVAPKRKTATLQVMARGPPLAAPTPAEAAAATALPHKIADPYGSAPMVYSIHLALWHLLISLAEPLTRTVSAEVASDEIQRTVDAYVTQEVSTASEPVAQDSELEQLRVSTRVASTELGIVVDASVLRACTLALSRSPYALVLHVRHGQLSTLPLVASGPNVYHIDVSIPEALLAILSDWLREADHACPPPRRDGHVVSMGHAGKMQLGPLSERLPWTAPLRAKQLPGSSMSPAHVRFRELKAELDPLGKFAPLTA
jgi:FAD/FMN-containing dehydrogenase